MGTLIQTAGGATGYEATSDNAFGLAYGAGVTSGNLLVVTIGFYHASATISSVSDSGGRVPTWIEAGTLLRGTGNTPVPALAVYYGLATSGGASTVNIGWSAAVQDKQLTLWEISGISSSSPLNGTQGASGNVPVGTQSVVTPDLVTTQPGFIIKVIQEYSWATSWTENSGTPNTGWSIFTGAETATGSACAYRNENGTGTYNGGYTFASQGNSDGYAVRIVAFADAPAAPALEPVYVFPPWVRV